MKINNIVRLDKLVYIGANEKFKTRIIIERLPDKEYQERQRKANAKAKKNGTKISKDNKAKMGMNIFVTNTDITANKVRPLYTLRWQIELMFKIWKSIGEIDKVKKMKVLRFVASLLTKLIWVVINWHIMRQIVIYFFNEHGIEISPYKLFKTLKGSMNKFREALKNGLTDLISFIDSIVEMSPRNHRSEKKSGMLTWSYDVLRMF
ncbi:MAG: transposase, partial [Bacteroidales bacterium]|nr:transposase [Bacteroidales bacterium]